MLDYADRLYKGEKIFIQGPWGFVSGNTKYYFTTEKNRYTEDDLRQDCDEFISVVSYSGNTKQVSIRELLPFTVGEVREKGSSFSEYGYLKVAGYYHHPIYVTWDGKVLDQYRDGTPDYCMSSLDIAKGKAYGRFIEQKQTAEDSAFLVDPAFKQAVIRTIWFKAERKVEKTEKKLVDEGLSEKEILKRLNEIVEEAKAAMEKLNAVELKQKQLRDLTKQAKEDLAVAAEGAMGV